MSSESFEWLNQLHRADDLRSHAPAEQGIAPAWSPAHLHHVKSMRAFGTFLTAIAFAVSALSGHATDIYREPWHWGAIPQEALPSKPAKAIGNASAFDRFGFRPRTTIQEIIATLGTPVSFARQYPVTRTEGVPVERIGGGPEAGTFRYLLKDGSEVLITVADFRSVRAVTRYAKAGWRHDLYENPDK